MSQAYLNRLSIATPDNDVHSTFVEFAERMMKDRRTRLLFQRMAARADIRRRWSTLRPAKAGFNESLDDEGFYASGNFPSTGARMRRYHREAGPLATKAVNRLIAQEVNQKITHLIVTSCTGFAAPGVDFEIIRRCNLEPSIERTVIGFMGCNAAINALKLARHIVRSETDSRVLIVSVELCTLHLQESDRIEQLLSFLLFGDGCAAAIVSADPHGFSLDSFHAELAQDASDQITWSIGDSGFDMLLSGQVPTTIAHALGAGSERILAGQAIREFQMWAVHPGGRSVLDAVEDAFELDEAALTASRNVLQGYGNMSSPTILFVLEALMRENPAKGSQGCAMAFGPGLAAECMLFSAAA
jgi:predicted naringenin-chalcone synthase